jgi:hypothetical protein
MPPKYKICDHLNQVAGTAEAMLPVFSNNVFENRTGLLNFHEEGSI